MSTSDGINGALDILGFRVRFCAFEVVFFLVETFFLAYRREVLTDGLAHRVGAMGLL